MAQYTGQAIREFDSPTTGNSAAFEIITIRNAVDNTIASIFDDEDLLVAKTNPFSADAQGFFKFFVADGNYNIQFGSPVKKTFFDIVIKESSAGEATDSGIAVGTTIISSVDLGPDFLERDGNFYSISDYPELAGKPGFPLQMNNPGGYNRSTDFTSDYKSSNIITTTQTLQSYSIPINGVSYILRNSISVGNVVKINYDGTSESQSTTRGGTLSLGPTHICHNEKIIVIATIAGPKLDIASFDYNTHEPIFGAKSVISTTYFDVAIRYFDNYDFFAMACSQSPNAVDIYLSRDGIGWTLVNTILTEAGSSTKALCFCNEKLIIYVDNSEKVYVADDIFLLTTSTLCFTHNNSTAPKIKGLFSDKLDFGIMISSTDNGIYTTTDSGLSFTRTTTFPDPSGCSCAVRSGDSSYLAAGNDNNVYFTSDSGLTWTEVATLDSPVSSAYISASKNVNFSPINSFERLGFSAIISPFVFGFQSTFIPPKKPTDKYYVKAR